MAGRSVSLVDAKGITEIAVAHLGSQFVFVQLSETMFAHICTLSRTDSSFFLRGTSAKNWPFSFSGSSQARGRS